MDFDFMAVPERSSPDVLHNITCGVVGNRNVYSGFADISNHQKKSKKVTS